MENILIRIGSRRRPGGKCIGLLALCIAAAAALPAHAASPTFAELLAEAKAQAAAGHRWDPPGDNMTETVMRMMDLIPTATPEQISDLSALLERDKASPASPRQDAPSANQAPPDGAQSAPVTPPVPATRALASTNPILTPAVHEPNNEPPGGAEQTARLRPGPDQIGPGTSNPGATLATSNGGAPSRPKGTEAGRTDSPPADLLQAGSNHPGGEQRVRGIVGTGQASPPPDSRVGLLFARGLDAELRGDISGARRFYLSAAEQGDAAAARNLGRLYDPVYLQQVAVGGIDPDLALAHQWYQRAVRLGDDQAGPLLEALSVR